MALEKQNCRSSSGNSCNSNHNLTTAVAAVVVVVVVIVVVVDVAVGLVVVVQHEPCLWTLGDVEEPVLLFRHHFIVICFSVYCLSSCHMVLASSRAYPCPCAVQQRHMQTTCVYACVYMYALRQRLNLQAANTGQENQSSKKCALRSGLRTRIGDANVLPSLHGAGALLLRGALKH